eukprot:GILK01015120.1.p1 GENE.GILK01015120.1~~GILK01015120.1.p1  ORF type:complete len:486 (+),score=58.00 GILK01015120.1:252-1709(+)
METSPFFDLARELKRQERSLLNRLKSISKDAVFVESVIHNYERLPVLANLRCGLWYRPKFDGVCYFKSTDGHTHAWQFSMTRLNLHVVHIAVAASGCIIVDSTRKGKRFPDSFSRTIPIWCCVVNNLINRHKIKLGRTEEVLDCTLHLPSWVSAVEASQINERIDSWVNQLEEDAASCLFDELAQTVRKPLRPLWVCPESRLSNQSDTTELSFLPIVCVSASQALTTDEIRSTQSWMYVQGAGDDAETWSDGLTPELFWAYHNELLNCDEDECEDTMKELIQQQNREPKPPPVILSVIGPSNLSVGNWVAVDDLNIFQSYKSVVNLHESVHAQLKSSKNYLHLPIPHTKKHRSGIWRSHVLPEALLFIGRQLIGGNNCLIVCSNGIDFSVCVLLAALVVFFDYETETLLKMRSFSSLSDLHITKQDIRIRYSIIQRFDCYAAVSRSLMQELNRFFFGDSGEWQATALALAKEGAATAVTEPVVDI